MTTHEPDVNQVKLRGTVSDVFFMNTKSGQDRLSFTVLTKSQYTDAYGDTIYTQEFTNCIAWSTAAQKLKNDIKVGSRVQVIGNLQTYTSPHKKDPSIIKYVTEIRTQRVEVIGFDSTFTPAQKNTSEFHVVDDFSDLE